MPSSCRSMRHPHCLLQKLDKDSGHTFATVYVLKSNTEAFPLLQNRYPIYDSIQGKWITKKSGFSAIFPIISASKEHFEKKNLAATISRYLLSKHHLTFTKEAVLVPATVYEDDSVEAVHPASASSVLRALVFRALTKGWKRITEPSS